MWWDEYVKAWNSHDGRAVAAFMTADGIYADVPLGARNQGRDAIAAWVDSIVPTLSSDYAMETTSFIESGDRYAAEWTVRGTNDGSSPEMPATGRQFAIHGVSIGELDNGKIRLNTDYWNMVEFLVQIGAMPAPEGATSH
jgi:steroid delta-isomerase-like uncharacterized protein